MRTILLLAVLGYPASAAAPELSLPADDAALYELFELCLSRFDRRPADEKTPRIMDCHNGFPPNERFRLARFASSQDETRHIGVLLLMRLGRQNDAIQAAATHVLRGGHLDAVAGLLIPYRLERRALRLYVDTGEHLLDMEPQLTAEERTRALQFVCHSAVRAPHRPCTADSARSLTRAARALSRSEEGFLFDETAEISTNDDLQTVLEAQGAMAGTATTFEIPVDGTLSTLFVTTALSGPRAAFIGPDGTPVRSSLDVRMTTMGAGPILAVRAPAPGVWRVRLEGTGEFSVTARGNSPLEFHRFEFVRHQSGPHSGNFPIDGLPLLGEPALGRATVFSPPANPEFGLVDEAGRPIRFLDLPLEYPTSDGSFVGPVPLPDVPFSVVMTGTDTQGHRVRRQVPGVFRGQTVRLAPHYDRNVVIPGRTERFEFSVYNAGPSPATFALSAVTSVGSIRDVNPAEVTILAGSTAVAAFLLDVPAEARYLCLIDVRLTATDIRNPASSNTALMSLDCGRKADVDTNAIGNADHP